jgi:hypothetical protein
LPDAIALFEEYAAAYANGERPRARDYLARAGPLADELAELIDAWLRAVPVSQPDEETIALVGSWIAGQPPLVELRARRGVSVDEVVDAMVAALKVDPTRRAKVKSYYQKLEQGLLDPSHVSIKVLTVLETLVGAGTRELLGWGSRPPKVKPAYFRRADGIGASSMLRRAAELDEEDEIDRLFTNAR